MPDVFQDGDAYERFMGGWSRLVAPAFVAWLGLPGGLWWVDVGCGTGALTSAILAAAAPSRVLGVDRSSAFADAARARVADEHAAFAVGDAGALPVASAGADVVVSGLVLNFLPDIAGALRDQTRAVRPGGTVAAFVWDYAAGMQSLRLFWDAAAAAYPSHGELDEGARFPICQPDALRTAWADAGLGDVATHALEVRRRFGSFDELWRPFLGGQGAAGGYLRQLDEAARGRVREEFRARVPLSGDGSIELTARAFAVRGTTSSRSEA